MKNQNPYNKLFDKLVEATNDMKKSCDGVNKIMKEITKISHKTHEMDKFATPVTIKQKGGR